MIFLLAWLACPKPVAVAPSAEPEPVVPKLHHRARNAYVRAHIYRAAGELEQAAQAYQRAMVFDPSSPVLVQELGELRAEQGKPEAAAALLERAIELGAGDPARGSLCQAQVALGEAVTVLSDWSPAPEQGWIWAQCVHRAFPDRDPQALLDAVQASLSLNPWNKPAWALAVELVHTHQRYATGLGWSRAALERNPWDADLLRVKVSMTRDPQGRDRDLGARISALRQLDALSEPVLLELAEATSRAQGQASLIPRLEEPERSLQLLALGEPAPLCESSGSLSCGLDARCLVSYGQAQGGAERMLNCSEIDPELRVSQALAWYPALWPSLRSGPSSPAVQRTGVALALEAGEPKAAMAQLQSLPLDDPWRPGLEGQVQLALGQDARAALLEGHERLPGDTALMAALAQAHYAQGDAEQAAAWAAKAAALGHPPIALAPAPETP